MTVTTGTELIGTALLTYALHSTLLLGMAWLLTRRLVRSHDLREVVWKTAVVGGLVSTAVQVSFGIQPPWGRIPFGRPAAASEPARPTARDVGTTGAAAFRPDGPGVAASGGGAFRPGGPGVAASGGAEPARGNEVDSSAVEAAASRVAPEPATQAGLPALSVVVWTWGALAALAALHLLVAQVFLVVRIGRRALVRDTRLLTMLERLREEAGIRRPIRLTRAEGLPSPVALGLSEICVPDAALEELDPEQQESMLAHELAHLARRDPLWLFGSWLVERVLFFQPLNRVARRRIQESAEYLCDDWAARRAGSGMSLASCLVKVAEWIDARGQAVPLSGMAETPSHFVSRIDRLIGDEALRPRIRRRWPLAAALGAVVLAAFSAPGVTSRSGEDANAPGASVEEAEPVADGSVVAALTQALKDSDAEVRQAAARSLGNRKDARAVPGLLAALADPDVEVRRCVVQALGEARDARVVDGLIEVLKDEDAEVRAHAAQALGESREPRARRALAGAIGDPSPDVRRLAIHALSEMKDGGRVAPLLAALKDVDAGVRQEAAQALKETNDPRAVAPLLAALADPSADVRHEVAHALGELKDLRAKDPLAAALKDENAEVAEAAAQALAELELREAPAALLEALADARGEVRKCAAEATGRIGDPRAVPALSRLVRDPDADVREAAVEALGQVRNPEASRALTAALKSEDPNVRRRAAEALGNDD